MADLTFSNNVVSGSIKTNGNKGDAKIGMSFNFGKLKGPYGEATCAGVVPLLLTENEFPVPQTVRDPALMKTLLTKFIPEYRGVWPNLLDDGIEARLRDYITMAACIFPTSDLHDARFQLSVHFFTLAFAFDDILDDAGFAGSLSYKDGKILSQFFYDLFVGKFTNLEELASPTASIRHIIEHVWAYYEALRENIPSFLEKSEHFSRSTALAIDAHVLVVESNGFSSKSKDYFQALCSGGVSGGEYCALLFGLEIPESIRQDLLFHRLNWCIAAAVDRMNDVFGLGRDIRLGQVKDSRILSAVVVNGVDLQEAFDTTLQELCDQINDIRVAVATLRGLYAAHEDFQKFLSLMEMGVDGWIRVYAVVERYNLSGMRIVKLTDE